MKLPRRTAPLPGRRRPSRPRRSSRQQDQAGFTLIELVIVMVILPLLIGGITEAIIATADNSNTVQTRFSDSAEAQIASTYFVRDVDDAGLVYTSPTPLCVPAGDTSTQVLGLEWTQGAADTAVSYVVETSAPYLVPSLVRYTCVASATPTSTVVVSSNICAASTATCQAPTVTVTCYDFFQLTCAPDSAGQWPAGGVSGVSLDMTGTGNNAFQYQLSASPRVTETGAGGSPAAPAPPSEPPAPGNLSVSVPAALLLLGTAAPDLDFDLASATIDVNGAVAADSSATGAISMGTRDNNTLNTLAPSTPVGSAQPPIQVFDCAQPAGASCNANPEVGPVAVSGSDYAIDPTPVSVTTPVTDPFLASPLPMPTTPPQGPGCDHSVSGGNGGNGGGYNPFAPPTTIAQTPEICAPGLYPTGLDVSASNLNITFNPGSYQFGQAPCTSSCGLTVSGDNDTVTFDQGDYTFEGSDSANCEAGGRINNGSSHGGIDISGSSDALSGGSGVFFYVAGGQANFDCGQSVSVNLTPMTSGSYDGVLLWQSSSDDLPVVLTGNGTQREGFERGSSGSPNFYTGLIYAPNAQVQLTGNGQTLTTGQIVAQSLTLGLSCVTIGANKSACDTNS